jgi:hypothetical protein
LDANLNVAAGALVVANTPLYLIRKLRSDASVQGLSREFNGQALRDALRLTASTRPVDHVSAVKPYAFLVALAMKPSGDELRDSMNIVAHPAYEWFDFIRRALVENTSGINLVNIIVPPSLNLPLFQSTSPAEFKEIIIPKM